jgi:hypothetical protein
MTSRVVVLPLCDAFFFRSLCAKILFSKNLYQREIH